MDTVAKGEQRQAEKMLLEYPWLANYQGDVIDLSDRSFKKITGLQYTVWALDWHMWTGCVKYARAVRIGIGSSI